VIDAVRDHYRALLDQHEDSLSETCLTWCRSGGADELAHTLGADVESAAPRTLRRADGEAYEQLMRTGGGDTLLVGSMPPWFVIMEPSGLRAAKSLDRLCVEAEAISLVIGDTLGHYSFLYGHGGATVCRLRWLDDPVGDVGPLRHHLADLSSLHGRDSKEWKVDAFVLAERITGVRLTGEWLSREHTRYFFRE